MSCYECDGCGDFKDADFDGCNGDEATGIKNYCEDCWCEIEYLREEEALFRESMKELTRLLDKGKA